MKDIAARVRDIPPSGIRRFFELAEEMDDVISLGVGEPDFSAPWSAREAAIDSLERGRTSYTANRGKRELRQRISQFIEGNYGLSYDPDNEVLVTTGVSEGLDLAYRSLIESGDNVAIPQPSYVSYVPGVVFSGGEAENIKTTSDNDFKLRYNDLERQGASDADLLVLCYPNNPTGAIMTESDLEEVADFVKEHDIDVISDEVYSELTYGDQHTSIAELPGMRDRTVILNGFSKAYAMTGMRLGYALGPSDVIDAMNRIHQYTMLSSPTTAQYMAIDALRHCIDDVGEMRKEYNRRRKLVLTRLRDMGIDCFEARGAFYVFPECPSSDEDEFAESLLKEEKVAVVPGNVFGDAGQGHLRISYATGMDELKEALNRISRFI